MAKGKSLFNALFGSKKKSKSSDKSQSHVDTDSTISLKSKVSGEDIRVSSAREDHSLGSKLRKKRKLHFNLKIFRTKDKTKVKSLSPNENIFVIDVTSDTSSDQISKQLMDSQQITSSAQENAIFQNKKATSPILIRRPPLSDYSDITSFSSNYYSEIKFSSIDQCLVEDWSKHNFFNQIKRIPTIPSIDNILLKFWTSKEKYFRHKVDLNPPRSLSIMSEPTNSVKRNTKVLLWLHHSLINYFIKRENFVSSNSLKSFSKNSSVKSVSKFKKNSFTNLFPDINENKTANSCEEADVTNDRISIASSNCSSYHSEDRLSYAMSLVEPIQRQIKVVPEFLSTITTEVSSHLQTAKTSFMKKKDYYKAMLYRLQQEQKQKK